MDAEEKKQFSNTCRKRYSDNFSLVFCTCVIEHDCSGFCELCSTHLRKGGIDDLCKVGASNSAPGEMDTSAKKQFGEQFEKHFARARHLRSNLHPRHLRKGGRMIEEGWDTVLSRECTLMGPIYQQDHPLPMNKTILTYFSHCLATTLHIQ